MSSKTETNPNLQIFPLYDNLVKKLSERSNFSINDEYKYKLSLTINSLLKTHHEQITLLIIHHYFTTNNDNPFISDTFKQRLPYNIKLSSSGKGLSFNINMLPIFLQAILGTYCGL